MGATNKAKQIFRLSSQSVGSLWKRYTGMSDERGLGGDHTHHYYNCGRKKTQLIIDNMLKKCMDIPEEKRQTICDIASALKIPKSSLGRLVKKGAIKIVVECVKPYLTQINKIKRVSFALEHIDADGFFQYCLTPR